MRITNFIFIALLLIANQTIAQKNKPDKDNNKTEKPSPYPDTFYISSAMYCIELDSNHAKWGFYVNGKIDPSITFDTMEYRWLAEEKIPYFLVRKNNLWGMYDKDRKEIVPPQYDAINYDIRSKPHRILVQKNKLYGILNQDGKPFLAIEYQDILFNGLQYKLQKNNLVGIVDNAGKELIPTCFESIYDNKDMQTCLVQKNKKWSVYQWNKENPCQPTVQYDQIEYFLDYYLVKQNNLWGVVDVSNKIIIPIKYKEIFPFYQNFLSTIQVIDQNDKTGLLRIEPSGEVATEIPIEYDNIGVEEATLKIKIRKGDKIDYYFEDAPYLNLKYNDVYYFENVNAFTIKKDGKWGLANAKGQEVIKPMYDKILIINGLNFLVLKDKRWGLVGGKGQLKTEITYEDFNYDSAKKTMFFLKKKKWYPFPIK